MQAAVRAMEVRLPTLAVGTPTHTAVSRSLAETYADLARSHEDDALGRTRQIEEGRRATAPPSALGEWIKLRERATSSRDAYQAQTVTICRKLVAQPGHPSADEILYLLASTYEALRATDPADRIQLRLARESRERALATYLELVKNHPTSKLVSAAYVAFGDLYFDEAAGGRAGWEIPREAYERVTRAGQGPGRAFAYAHYRLGFVRWQMGNKGDASAAFGEAIAAVERDPSIPSAKAIQADAEAALAEL